MRKLMVLSFLLLPFSVNSIGFVGIAARGVSTSHSHHYRKLCMMIPECAAEMIAEQEERTRKKEARELRLATPSKKREPIPEFEIMENRLKGVKILKRE